MNTKTEHQAFKGSQLTWKANCLKNKALHIQRIFEICRLKNCKFTEMHNESIKRRHQYNSRSGTRYHMSTKTYKTPSKSLLNNHANEYQYCSFCQKCNLVQKKEKLNLSERETAPLSHPGSRQHSHLLPMLLPRPKKRLLQSQHTQRPEHVRSETTRIEPVFTIHKRVLQHLHFHSFWERLRKPHHRQNLASCTGRSLKVIF